MTRLTLPRIFRYALLAALVFLSFYLLMDQAYRWHVAHADPMANIDAGVPAGSGSGTASAVLNGSGSGSGSGSATVPTFTVDPSHPIETVTTAWGLIKQLGWIVGLMIVVFGVGTAMVKFADDEHWLSKDHALPIATSFLGTLAAVIGALTHQSSWAAVAGALIASVMLIIQKPKPSAMAQATTAAK